MHKLMFLLLLSTQIGFGQNMDSTFTINTPNSEILFSCKKIYENNLLIESSVIIKITLTLNASTLEEAEKNRLQTAKYYVNLHFNSSCELIEISPARKSMNTNFNEQVEQYFDECIAAFKSNNLSHLLSKFDGCGSDLLIFSYSI